MMLLDGILLACIVVMGVFIWLERRAYSMLLIDWQREKNDRRDAEAAARDAKALRDEALAYAIKLERGLTNNERLLTAQASVNERICKERDETHEIAQLQALRLGNGQQMFMQALSDLARNYNAYRAKHGDKPVELDAGLRQIMETAEKS